jgi:hypothetical protein
MATLKAQCQSPFRLWANPAPSLQQPSVENKLNRRSRRREATPTAARELSGRDLPRRFRPRGHGSSPLDGPRSRIAAFRHSLDASTRLSVADSA